MKWTPFKLGVADGICQPHDFSMGMTWEYDQDANEWYDKGANVGQVIGKIADFFGLLDK